MHNFIRFRIINSSHLRDIIGYITVISAIVAFMLISFVSSYPLFYFFLTIYFISYCVDTFMNFLSMNGTISLEDDSIRIIHEKEQYAFSTFEPVEIGQELIAIKDISEIKIHYVNYARVKVQATTYVKNYGDENIICIKSSNGENTYRFYSDNKKDRKNIVRLFISWKRNYNITIIFDKRVIEEKDLEGFEDYAYS